ncbi:hypothetical protein [Algoriphagus chordae]|uniref:Uncharacterized protein n=1 Tax=Algoriphagus chordae TaxID=237019 RepID=A0A2W7SPP5_9BACT|nr:hypothetical protein [Algoriphagus chordae]PZX52652.1 hypothetical protein LV85_01954 [Algoriphagus chordae]
MKKTLSIFLFACFAIYHFGYYAFYFSYDQHIESKWEEKIYGENSVEVQEMLLEVPLSAPYMANQEDFHTTNTSFEKDGQYYRAIKQRYQNDTLQVIVVPDTARGLLDNTVKKWISFLTDDETSQDHNGKQTIKLIAKDYIQPIKNTLAFTQAANSNDSPDFQFLSYTNPFFQLHTPPPRLG